jgi:peptidyl-prolyl cis-trans isomerase B (cyclophilin B)
MPFATLEVNLRKCLYGFLVLMLSACTPASHDTGSTAVEAGSSATAATSTTTAAENVTPPPPAKPVEQEKPMSEYENKVAELHVKSANTGATGTISIRFFPQVAPNHVRNFIDLAEKGFYNGVKFHRVIPGFMIQGGDPNTVNGDPGTWGIGGSGKNLKAEFNSVSHNRGIVSMARSGHPDSASSQFFIVVADTHYLDGQYTAFGEVTSGMEVVDAIANAPVVDRTVNRPKSDVVIERVTIRDAKEDEKGPLPK